MRVGGDDAGFFSTGLLVVLLGVIATLGISHMGANMKNVTFKAPAVKTTTAVAR